MISTFLRQTKWIILVLFCATSLTWGSIGNVDKLKGNGVVDREDGDTDIRLEKELDIFSNDTIKTGKGKVGILFIDDTRVDVTEHSRLLIDDFVFDPNTATGTLSLKASLGTIRYASGQIAKNSAQNINIETPTASIGVRGTDFSMTIDELGSSTIILLPSCDVNGNCFVGEISVESDAGQVILNQAFQATVVDVPERSPMTPVLLNLDESLINNLLIIARPPQIEDEEYQQNRKKVANILDLDFLEFDELEKNYLDEEEDLYVTGLDIDLLEQNFLADILQQINEELALQMRNEFDKKTTIGDIQLGKNPETGVIILDEDPNWVWIREGAAGGYIELRLDKEYGYLLNIIQSEFEIIDFQLGGQENQITIQQFN